MNLSVFSSFLSARRVCKGAFLGLAALFSCVFCAQAASEESYTLEDFTPAANNAVHLLQLRQPLTFGAEDWTLTLRVKIGKGYYQNDKKESWGSTLIAAGANAFPEHYDFKPFQIFIPIVTLSDSAHPWGGLPVLNEQGNPTIEGITYVLSSTTEQVKDTSLCPALGERWSFVLAYKASDRRLTCTVQDERNSARTKTVSMPDSQQCPDYQIDTLSTSMIALDGWELKALTVTQGNAEEPRKEDSAPDEEPAPEVTAEEEAPSTQPAAVAEVDKIAKLTQMKRPSFARGKRREPARSATEQEPLEKGHGLPFYLLACGAGVAVLALLSFLLSRIEKKS